MKKHLIFDFSRTEDAQGWEGVNDVVMGGRSRGSATWRSDGSLVFEGVVSFANGGGFASVRSPVLTMAPGSWGGFALNLQGDGRTYKFSVRTDTGLDGISHQVRFATRPGTWEELLLPFTKFVPSYHGVPVEAGPLDSQRIKRIGLLIADRQEGPFRLAVASVAAYES